jgi:ankyrin repeat protein
MKKSIVCLGIALLAFTNVSLASETPSVAYKRITSEYYGASPMNVAISKGDIKMVLKFIEYGTDINKRTDDDMTPLMTAARYNKVEIIKILLAQGARPNIKNSKGFTALKYAQLSNAAEAVALLQDLR